MSWNLRSIWFQTIIYLLSAIHPFIFNLPNIHDFWLSVSSAESPSFAEWSNLVSSDNFKMIQHTNTSSFVWFCHLFGDLLVCRLFPSALRILFDILLMPTFSSKFNHYSSRLDRNFGYGDFQIEIQIHVGGFHDEDNSILDLGNKTSDFRLFNSREEKLCRNQGSSIWGGTVCIVCTTRLFIHCKLINKCWTLQGMCKVLIKCLLLTIVLIVIIANAHAC